MFDEKLMLNAQKVISHCRQIGIRLVTAESCTGGLISAALTAVPGSSNVLDRAFVVYSNESKCQELAVPYHLLEQYGAVSKEVTIAMAEGALARSYPHAQMCVAVSGIAGPEGSQDKPVGLVHFAVARNGKFPTLHECHEFGDIGRNEVRECTVNTALSLLISEATED
ncbi:MAG: CinA family protein [Candidatus Scalindua sp.]|jgi:nicotinamide-nucleotide amidase|nr:CinA family protein [Candidatus Scalindua sp.]MBT5303638.1 CinA family protein [Candidatus Scalindua sp.]MBT6049263.1 CinA family protein [Candidatus Scalindua sp.]MBT6229795.1 CinA family protein [Candidatus Scalindua sp.]MBT6565078.1 CinA family protein [Candidatus Scalindua sp.]